VLAPVHAGMTGNAKPSDITAHGMFIFHSFIFYMPMILLVVAALIYQFKVTLSEKKHAEIVKELESKLETEKVEEEAEEKAEAATED